MLQCLTGLRRRRGSVPSLTKETTARHIILACLTLSKTKEVAITGAANSPAAVTAPLSRSLEREKREDGWGCHEAFECPRARSTPEDISNTGCFVDELVQDGRSSPRADSRKAHGAGGLSPTHSATKRTPVWKRLTTAALCRLQKPSSTFPGH